MSFASKKGGIKLDLSGSNSTRPSLSSMASDISLDSIDDSTKPRRPRPKPINLGQMLQPNNKEPKESSKSSIADVVQDQLTDKDLTVLEELGMGNQGTVFKVLHKQTNTMMAKKIIHQLSIKEGNEILRELQVLKKCKSPYIVSFYGAYQNEGELCICMEYMDVGSLEKISKIVGKLPENILVVVIRSVLKGLVYLYQEWKIIHRDIKPSNILVNSKGLIKICDFGVSRQLENSIANTFVGTGAYMSPERIQGAKYATQSDSWALGLTILELAIARYPFNSGEDDGLPLSEFELLHHIIHDEVPDISNEFSESFCSFIHKSLEKDPLRRPTPAELLKHPLLEKEEKVDMITWAQSFLEPNLDAYQIRRWSISLAQKRQSVNLAKEKRMSKAKGALTASMENGLNNLSLKKY